MGIHFKRLESSEKQYDSYNKLINKNFDTKNTKFKFRKYYKINK